MTDRITLPKPKEINVMHRFFIHTICGKGSTGFHAADPPQPSDGRSDGVPRTSNAPALRKPAVLATLTPAPSQGTPGTARCAGIYHPGPALPRQQRDDGGAESPLANRWKALVMRTKAKVKQWQAQIHRYYLARMRKHLALATKRTFRFVQLIAFTIGISVRMLFRKSRLPYGAINRFVHDCRYALFRRRAVSINSGNHLRLQILPGQLLGERRRVRPMTD